MSQSSAKVLGVDHISLLVEDSNSSVEFYQSILGLQQIERPELGFPGAWLQLGPMQTLHLLELDNPYASVDCPKHGGRDRHFALRVAGFDAFKQRLDAKDIPYTQSQSGRKALFFKDLDKNVIELYEL